jgi:hypothetical protein
MAKPIKTHTFMGKRYNIKSVSPSKLTYQERGKKRQSLGICQNPKKKGKTLKFNNTLTDKEELEVYIHEAKHACHWYFDEHTVEKSSLDLADFLWRLGYRKVK